MAINFPSSPTIGQVYEYQSIRWRWNGSAWDKYEVFTFNGLTANVEGVSRFNGLTGSVGISAGQLIDITLTGSTFTISSPDTLYGISGNIYASNLATGLLYGGILSINAGNTAQFDITGGKGQIHASGSGFTSGPFPLFNYVTWPGQTGITLTYLATHDTTWIYIDETGVLHQRTEYYTDEQLEENIIIGQLLHPSRTYINLARTNPNVAYATDKQYEQFIRAFGPIKVSGHTITPNGANLKLNRSSGKAFSLGRNWINDTDNPSVVSDSAQTDCIFYRYYRGITAGTFITVPNQTVIDPGNYDDGSGTLQAAPGGKYSIQRLFYYPNTPTLLGVYYGRALYNSLADAAANINLEQFTEIENTRTNAIFAGYLIVRAGTTNLSNSSDALILQSGSFRSTTSGGGSVSLTLDDLTDVIITSPQDLQVLAYVDGVTGWENKSVSTLPLVYSFNGATGAVSGVNSVNGLTGVLTVSGGTGMSVLSGGKGITLVNTGVLSFNGLTGAVTGVTTSVANIFGPVQTFNSGISAAGATLSRTTTIPAGSTLSVLGNITGNVVSSIDGSTGAITNVARTNVDNNFSTNQTITNGMDVTIYGVNEIYFYNDFSGTETYLYPSNDAFGTAITLPGGVNTTLAGLATTQTFTAQNTFSSRANFSAGISAAGSTFTGNINFQNAEFIRNSTNGRMDFMPAPSGTTHYGMYMDFTSWGFGPALGTIRSSDGSTNVAGIRWDTNLVTGNDVDFSFGSNQAYKIRTTVTNVNFRTLQLGLPAATTGYSSALALMDYAFMGSSVRQPNTVHSHPNLYIYAAGAANANDFIRFEHDRTNANIVTGQTSGILIQPGSGWLGISGGLSASGGITFTQNITIRGLIVGSTGSNLLFATSAGAGMTGTNNMLFGLSAGRGIVAQSDNVAIGNDALRSTTPTSRNVALGINALLNNTRNDSVAIGQNALSGNVGLYVVGLGTEAGLNNSGGNVMALGFNTLRNNAANNQVGVGPYALYQNTSSGANNNIAIGVNALWQNSGFRNTAIGNDAFVGSASFLGQSGNRNVGIGFETGYNNRTGSDNIFIGALSGRGITSGSNNIYIGSGVSAAASGLVTNEIIIGTNMSGAGSNTTTIGTASTTATRLFGVVASGVTAPTIASAGTIAPTTPIVFVSGTTTINTITAPTGIASTGGQIVLIPTGLWSTGTSGNIALATTAVVNRALVMVYDAGTVKWYPSY